MYQFIFSRPAKDDPSLEWNKLWYLLREQGCLYYNPNNERMWGYFMLPPVAGGGTTAAERLAQGVEGVDYFTSQEDVKQYARDNFGWLGRPCALSTSKFLGQRAASRRMNVLKSAPSSKEQAQTRTLSSRKKRKQTGGNLQLRSPQTPSTCSDDGTSPSTVEPPPAQGAVKSIQRERKSAQPDAADASFNSADGQEHTSACFDHPSPARESPKQNLEGIADTLHNAASATADETRAEANKYLRAVDPHLSWHCLWAELRKDGWKYCSGNQLVAWYWIRPDAAQMKKTDMLRECTEGVHYFSSEAAVRKYASQYLGWKGDDRSPTSPSDASESMTTTGRKRKQRADLRSDAASQQKKMRSEKSNSEPAASPTQMSPANQTHTFPGEKGKGPLAKAQSGSHDSKRSDGDNANSVPSSKEEYKAPPDLQPTVIDKLEACQMALHPSFNKTQLPKSASMAVVSPKENEIKDFMTKAIETGLSIDGMAIPSPGFMYICGGPGTGKTAAVTTCVQEMKQRAKSHGHARPRICLINVASLNPKGSIMRAMLMKLAAVVEIDKESKLSDYANQFRRKAVVLILDEIDMLFAQQGGSGEQMLKTLVQWAHEKDLRFSLIGISNCVNDINARRIREIGNVSDCFCLPV